MNIKYLLYSLLIISSIIQDSILSNVIGEFGKSISSLIIYPIFIIVLINIKLKTCDLINRFLKLVIYLLIIDFLALFVFCISNNSLYFLGEYVPIKCVKQFAYPLSNLLFIISIFTLGSNLKKNELYRPFIISFIILFFINIIELVTTPYSLPLFHTVFPYWRIRLLSPESSYTASTIIIFGLACINYYKNINKNRIKLFTILIMLSIMIISSESKSLISVLFVGLVIYIFNSHLSIIKKSFIISLGAIAGILLLGHILLSFKNDIENYTSIATRLVTMLSAISISLQYPFGVSHVYSNEILINKIDYFISLIDDFYHFNWSELLLMLNEKSDKNIGAKSGLLQTGLYWGIIGNIYLLLGINKIYNFLKNEKNEILLYSLICIVILILSSTPIETKYDIWSYFGLLCILMHNKAKRITL